jgi:hypothetical protein
MKLYACACAMLLAPFTATAQTPSFPIAAPATTSAVLRTGTEIPLKLSEMVTTKGKKLKVGQRIHMEVAAPVLVNGIVVVPAGSPAMGEITEVRNKGMWGKSGHFTGRALYTTVNGRQMRLSGGFDDKGTTGTAGVVGAIALLPVAGFFMTGTSAELPIGAPVKGFMDEDVQLAMPAADQAPLVVGPPATVAVSGPVTAPTASGAAMTVQPAALRQISTAPTQK